MRLLITGGTGFIGRHLVEYWQQCNHSIGVVARSVDASLFDKSITCVVADITSKDTIEKAVFSFQPDIVIHTAALSKPNDCEANQELCFTTNVSATEYISAACKTIGARLIFLSTDFVFGNGGPYSEADGCEPVNYYGESKWLAEEIVKEADIPYAIVRTGLVVGPRLQGQPNTFLHWVKDSLEAGKMISLYTDQQRSPTFVSDLCKGIDAIITTGFTGTIHLSGSETFSPFGIGQEVIKYFGFNSELVIPVTSAQRPEPARRPQNAVLNIALAKKVLGYTATPFDEIMRTVFKQQQ